jgi:PIN like domain
MRVLLDEDVPVPLIKLVRHLLKGHDVDHVEEIGWKGKTDVNIYKDARARGYDVVITNNIRQLNDPDECDAIKKSGRHVVLYNMDDGLQGLALASGAICAAIRPAVEDLAKRTRQHLVRITALAAGKRRYVISDPAQDPPSAYWR